MTQFKALNESETMVLFQKPEKRRGPSERQLRKARYASYLVGLAIGEGGEMILDEDEKKITVRSRLNAAAKELGIELEYKPTRGQVVQFRVNSL